MARKFWSAGITVKPVDGGCGFVGVVTAHDDYFANAKAAHITITTYVLRTMANAIDSVKASAEDLGIEWSDHRSLPSLFIYGDGEYKDVKYPENWREQLQKEADRIGWATYAKREPA